MPPTLASWRKRARSIGLNLDECLTVDRGYEGNKPITVYKFTDKGREVFGGQTETARAAVNDSGR